MTHWVSSYIYSFCGTTSIAVCSSTAGAFLFCLLDIVTSSCNVKTLWHWSSLNLWTLCSNLSFIIVIIQSKHKSLILSNRPSMQSFAIYYYPMPSMVRFSATNTYIVHPHNVLKLWMCYFMIWPICSKPINHNCARIKSTLNSNMPLSAW